MTPFGHITRFVEERVLRPIDKAVLQPLRHVTDKEVALKTERDRLARLKLHYDEMRPQFYDEKMRLTAARGEYERLSEDFSALPDGAVPDRPAGVRDPGWQDPPESSLAAFGQGAEDLARGLLGSLSFDLTEVFWNVGEIPEERAYLDEKAAQYRVAISELREKIAKMSAARRQYETESQTIRTRLAALGQEASASDLTLQAAQSQARRQIVRQLAQQGLAAAQIAAITGFAPDLVHDTLQEGAGQAAERTADD